MSHNEPAKLPPLADCLISTIFIFWLFWSHVLISASKSCAFFAVGLEPRNPPGFIGSFFQNSLTRIGCTPSGFPVIGPAARLPVNHYVHAFQPLRAHFDIRTSTFAIRDFSTHRE